MSSILDTYARKPISFIRGEGSFLYTEKKEKYLLEIKSMYLKMRLQVILSI